LPAACYHPTSAERGKEEERKEGGGRRGKGKKREKEEEESRGTQELQVSKG
jgi:hypothetical protein